MQELSKKILEEYQVRKTKEQKTKFIHFLQQELQEYTIEIEEGGFCKSRNIVIGDLKNSKIILGAHYDTAPVLPFPNFLTPKNILIYVLYCLLIAAGYFLIDTILIVIALQFTDNFLIIAMLNWGLLILLVSWMLVGKENKHTANDNTSGVITLIEALHDEKIKNNVCCVLFDHEEAGLFGSAFFAKKHKKELKEKLLINFDCVSDGDTIMMILSKTMQEEWPRVEQAFVGTNEKEFVITKSSTTLYPSDQMNFKHYIGVAAFKKKRVIGYYIDRIHTAKDVIFDEKNIAIILEGLRNFVKGDKNE